MLGLAEKAIQTGKRRDPEQQQLVIGSNESVPRVLGNELGNEYRCGFLNWATDIHHSRQNVSTLSASRPFATASTSGLPVALRLS
jgi:hypothetical protein